jgi:cytochrome c oxidase subunit II
MKLKFVLVALFTVMLIAAVVTVAPAPAQTAPRRIEITASRFKFEPAEITLKKGEPVVIVLKSADVTHGLRFRDLDFNLKANKGQTSELPFTPTKTGDFVGQCSVFCGPGHGTMKLTLHVVE